MRQLALDEKISIKGQLSTKGVLRSTLVRLDMPNALSLFWFCFGRPASTHSTPCRWHKTSDRRDVRARKYQPASA
jgi:hypothetical protein